MDLLSTDPLIDATCYDADGDGTFEPGDDTVVVEGNHYFPADCLRAELFRASDTHTTCGWKGVASYYDVVVGEERNTDAAWFYSEPKEAAANIKDRVAFWRGVEVVE